MAVLFPPRLFASCLIELLALRVAPPVTRMWYGFLLYRKLGWGFQVFGPRAIWMSPSRCQIWNVGLLLAGRGPRPVRGIGLIMTLRALVCDAVRSSRLI